MSLPNPAPSARDTVPADQLVLQVLAGRHAGVCVPLEPAGCCIGSAPDADVLLRDPGVAPVHVRLQLDRLTLCVEAEGADVGVGDELLPMGHGCRVRLPTELVLGEARLMLARPAAAPGLDGSFTDFARELLESIGVRRIAVVVVLFVALLPLSIIAYPRGGAEMARPAPPGVGAVAPGAVASLEQAMGELVSRIDEARLRSLRVRMLDGGLVVSGQLAARELEAWKAIERWFDRSYGGRHVLVAKVATNQGRSLPPPQLQAIWFGVAPYILTANGARHEPGSVLDNGWTVSEIGEGRLVLAKDGETLTLTYP